MWLRSLPQTNRGQKTLFKKNLTLCQKGSSMRLVILRHSGVCCSLQHLWGYFFFLRKKQKSQETCHLCVHTQTRPRKHNWTHSKPWAANTQEGGLLPDVLPLLQYRQADGAFFFCVFICPLILVLLTMELSLFLGNIREDDFWYAASGIVLLPQQTHYIW